MFYILVCSAIFGQEIQYERINSAQVPEIKSDIEGLNWYRFVSNKGSPDKERNFEILSLDKKEGISLYQNVEKIRSWIFTRWSLSDINFNKRCMIICVPTKELYVKLFSTDKRLVKENVIWYYVDSDSWMRDLCPYISQVCYREIEQKYNIKFDYWAIEGMCALNGSAKNIKSSLRELGESFSDDEPCYWSEQILNTTANDSQNVELFNKESMALCLFFVKERSKKGFLTLATNKDKLASLKNLGFKTYETLDSYFNTYVQVLGADINSKKFSDSYLTVGDE